MKAKKFSIIAHGIFFIIVLIVFLVLTRNGIINLGDVNFPLDLKYYLEKSAYAWYISPAIGWDAGYAFNFNQFYWYLSLLLKMGISMETAQAIAYAVLYYLPFLFCYLLFRRVLKTGIVPAFLASLFYVLNPFYLGQWYVPIPHNLAVFVTIPLIAFLIARFWMKPIKLILFSFLSFLFLAFANANTALAAVAFITILAFSFVFQIYNQGKFDFKRLIINYSLIVVSFALAGSWWLLNIVFTAGSLYGEYSNRVNLVEWLQSVSKLATVSNIISLRFALPFTRAHLLVTYLPFFFSVPVNLISYFPFVLVILSAPILFKKKKALTIWLFAILFIAIFFTKALNPPLGNLFLFLFQKIPFFGIFKSAPEKFGVFFIFWLSLMLGIILENLQGKLKIIYLAGLTLSLVVFAYPLYSLQVVTSLEIGKLKITPFYREPKNYRQLRDYLNNNPEYSRVLSINGTGNYVVTTDLKNGFYFHGLDPLAYNTNKSFVEQNNPQGNIGSFLFYNLAHPEIYPLLPSLDIDYILVNQDNVYEEGKPTLADLKKNQNLLYQYFDKEKSWGNLLLFEAKKEKNLPKIYAGSRKIIALGQEDVLFSALAFTPDDLARIVFYPPPQKIADLREFDDLLIAVYPARVEQGASSLQLIYSAEFPLGGEYEIFAKQEGKDWSSLGSRNLNQGEQTLTLEIPSKQVPIMLARFAGLAKEKTIPATSPKITFTRISPVEYRVMIAGAQGSFPLVFSEGFSPAWKAYVIPGAKVISEERHFMVNGFVNGWLVKPEDTNNAGDFEIVIKYANQQYFYWGAVITGISFLVLLLIQFFPKHRI